MKTIHTLANKAKTGFELLTKAPGRVLEVLDLVGPARLIPDSMYLRIVFKAHTGYALNLKSPQTYNEKLQWIKLHERNDAYSTYADKAAVREIVRKKIGTDILVPLFGIYDKVSDIDWDVLPNSFVLKCSHGSGFNILCPDKNELNIDDACNKLKKWMTINQYWGGREWCYRNIKPRIVCEAWIGENGKTPNDYKFMCFGGHPRIIQLHEDRYGNHTLDYYSPEWQRLEIRRSDANIRGMTAPRPTQLDTMLEIAKCLSADFPYARVDLYEVKGHVFFGEVTFYPMGGFSGFANHQDDLRIGSWIPVP